ncbi:hypothetical protein M885DRAFT_487354 [Pelagophyceae sp. CCMP2097]|nr:hypothetical protein M885DRAFT_487354 [Pelagophyceae sp. CCMP2097]
MGSDDGKKARRGPSLWGALACLAVATPLLLLEHRLSHPRDAAVQSRRSELLAVKRRGTALRLRNETAMREAREARLAGVPLVVEPRHDDDEPKGAGPPPPPVDAPPPHEAPLAPPEAPLAASPEAPSQEPAHQGPSLKEQLIALARLPPREAIAALDADPLGIEGFENASAWKCPAQRLLQRAPSQTAASAMRAKAEGAFVWFEHLSKAGGTSFCAFARKNLGPKRTPSYYCMPSEGAPIKGTDGRVGTWDAPRLADYVKRTGHAVLANEWDEFPGAMLCSGFLDSAVLTAVMRDPVDRLVSTYKFWGIFHNPNKHPPPLLQWLAREDAGARRWPIRSNRNNFASQVGRNNFATWKFSAGTSERFDDCGQDVDCAVKSLMQALDSLENFHIVAPTKWQAHAKPLWQALGFTKLDEVHIVPSGKIQDSKADEIGADDLRSLKEKNHLDYIVWAWVRRAFLERIHCRD